MPLAYQIVQSSHAVLTIASSAYIINGTPNIILIGVPNKAALERAQRKLAQHAIPHCAWVEPDMDLGFTSIATIPLDCIQKQVLANYRLWSPMLARSSEKEQSAAPKAAERSEVQFLSGEPPSMTL